MSNAIRDDINNERENELLSEQDVYFYSHTKNKFQCFSNFYNCLFMDDETGIIYNTSEQYFMHQKILTFNPSDKKSIDIVLSTKSPTVCKRIGRKVKKYNELVWRSKRKQIMERALFLKFTQNFECMLSLLKTKNKKIYEASKFDKIWGIGYDYKTIVLKNIDLKKYGKNLLGKILMNLRDKLLPKYFNYI